MGPGFSGGPAPKVERQLGGLARELHFEHFGLREGAELAGGGETEPVPRGAGGAQRRVDGQPLAVTSQGLIEVPKALDWNGPSGWYSQT